MKYTRLFLHVIWYTWLLFASNLYAEDQVKSEIMSITLLDKGHISVEVETVNNTKEIILYNPHVFVMNGSVVSMKASLAQGIYRPTVTIYPPKAQIGVPIVGYGWDGLVSRDGDLPPVRLQPGEKLKSPVELNISDMIGRDFIATLSKGIEIQVSLQTWDSKTQSRLETLGTLYKLSPPIGDDKKIGFTDAK